MKAPAEIQEFILANYIGCGYINMAKRINETFPGADWKPSKVKSFYGNHKLNSGRTGRFEKGQVPPNKGKKWDDFMPKESQERSRRTTFKKGNVPYDHKEVGTLVFRPAEGYYWRKVKEPNKWEMEHRLIWEREHGKIPKGMNVVFINGDTKDLRIENLELLTDAENARAQRYRASKDYDIGKAGVIMAKLATAINEREEKKNEK